MTATISTLELQKQITKVGDSATLLIEFTEPVFNFDLADFLVKDATLSDFKILDADQYSFGASRFSVKVTATERTGGTITLLDNFAIDATTYTTVEGGSISFDVVPNVSVLQPKVTLQSTGEDDIYNIEEADAEGKVSVTIAVPKEAKVGDTLTIDGEDILITAVIIKSGVEIKVEPEQTIEVSITNTAGTGSTVTVTVPSADLDAPNAPTISLDQDANGDGVVDYIELQGDNEAGIEFTVDVGSAEVGDTLILDGQQITITDDIINNGYHGTVPATAGSVAIEAVVVDQAGNQSQVKVTSPSVDLTIPDAESIYLWHLGSHLTSEQGPADEHGKIGGKYGDESAYETGILNDSIYIGYTGKDADGNLITSKWDGDFERDGEDGDAVWNLETYAGHDLVYIREDQNAYTATKLGSGNDTYYAQGELDSVLGVAQYDPSARSYVYTESGDDTVVVGGNGEGQVTGWGIDGGRIFMGSGNDNVTVYGEVDDGAVIDLGAGMSAYANPVDEAAATTVDQAGEVNTLTITRNLGNGGDIDFGRVYGGAGDDTVNIGTYVEGTSVIDLGEGTNTVTIGDDLDGQAQVITGSGNDTLVIGDDTENYAAIDLGAGNNSIKIESTVEDHSTISTGSGDDVLNVGYAIANYATVDLGDGNNTIIVGDDIDGYSTVATGSGDDTLSIGDDTEDGAVINLGDGNNVINVNNTVEDRSVIKAGQGNDTLTVGYAITDSAVVDLGEGNNTITVQDDIDSNAKIITGDGDDTLTVNDDVEDYAIIDLGNGDNTITVADNVENYASIITGNGNDTITIAGITGKGSIDAGAGNDTIVFTGKNAGGAINGGVGTDTLELTYNTDNSLVTRNAHETNLSTKDISGIEVVKLNGQNAFDIRFEDLVQDTDRDGALFIQGNEDSKVDLGSTNWNSDNVNKAKFDDATTDGMWAKTGSAQIDGINYDIYQNSFATNDTNDVYIEQGVVVI